MWDSKRVLHNFTLAEFHTPRSTRTSLHFLLIHFFVDEWSNATIDIKLSIWYYCILFYSFVFMFVSKKNALIESDMKKVFDAFCASFLVFPIFFVHLLMRNLYIRVLSLRSSVITTNMENICLVFFQTSTHKNIWTLWQ